MCFNILSDASEIFTVLASGRLLKILNSLKFYINIKVTTISKITNKIIPILIVILLSERL